MVCTFSLYFFLSLSLSSSSPSLFHPFLQPEEDIHTFARVVSQPKKRGKHTHMSLCQDAEKETGFKRFFDFFYIYNESELCKLLVDLISDFFFFFFFFFQSPN